MRTKKALLTLAVAAGMALLVAQGPSRTQAASDNVIAAPDTSGDVGEWASLELDATGNPVVSYYDVTNADLMLLHCGNPSCTSGNSVETPDSVLEVGEYTSLELDASGNPVISYYDVTTTDLRLLHCNDPNCAGGNDVFNTPDTPGDVGRYTSLAIDASGFPVIGYYDGSPNNNLKIMHCNDAFCAGGGESITTPAATDDVGSWASLVLDASGKPVVSYYDATNGRLRLLHCGDPNCGPGGTIGFLAAVGDRGQHTSLALDASGNPVISDYDATNGDINVAHCDDVACFGLGDVISVPDAAGDAGQYTSLAMDSSGFPVVSYLTDGGLAVLRCGDANCTANNAIALADVNAEHASTSLVLDTAGNPVVAYSQGDYDDLNVLHCGNPACVNPNFSYGFSTPSVFDGFNISLALDSNGLGRIAYSSTDILLNENLQVRHCLSSTCGTSIGSTVDSAGDAGKFASIAVDASGFPVISYYDEGNGDLKVMHCNDAACQGSNESITTPDTAGDVGLYTSLALDAAGNPVVSYYDFTAGNLKVLHCNDPNCAPGGDSITTPDATGDVGRYTALVLDASGNPVIGYYAVFGFPTFKLALCLDPNCTAIDVHFLGGAGFDYGQYSSVALTATGIPVASFYEANAGSLNVWHCSAADCSGPISVYPADTVGDVGQYTSIDVASNGNPVASYYDVTNGDLKVLHCGNPACDSGNLIFSPDVAGNVGAYSSMELDSRDNPLIAYRDATHSDLKILYCRDCDADADDDGCTNTQEAGGNPVQGGLRNATHFWDFFDVPTGVSLARDRSVSSLDIFAVIGRFNSTGNASIDPLSTPPAAPAYHPAYDRGAIIGANVWDLAAANGSIAATDIFAVIGQFNHSCG